MKQLIRLCYNRTIRPFLPEKIAVFNGVPVRTVRLLDQSDVFPSYEEPLLRAIRNHVGDGDTVVVVGGGLGVSSVVAARQCGKSGSVITFEGGESRAALAAETSELNGVEDVVSVNHSIVGTAVQVQGDTANAQIISPDELPECDVLVMDCEGAEMDILESDFDARSIIVETHEFLDAPEDAVRDLLSAHGYDVVDRGVEIENLGVYILTALADDRMQGNSTESNTA